MGTANFGIAGLDWQQRVNWDRLREVPHRARARDDEEARPRRHALHVRRERALHHRHAHAGLEPAQARPALRHAVRRRRADPVRAGRPRLPDRAPLAVDPEGERPLLVRLDQGRGGPGLDPAGEQVHQGDHAGDEGERRRRPEARRRLHRHQHDQHLQGEEHQLGRRHDADDGGARGQERRTSRNACASSARSATPRTGSA